MKVMKQKEREIATGLKENEAGKEMNWKVSAGYSIPCNKSQVQSSHKDSSCQLFFSCLQRLCYIDKGISGFAIDWINQDILWANRQKGTIEATDMNGKKRRVLLRAVGRPTRITIDAEQR